VLELRISTSGTVTGTRTTIAPKDSPKVFQIAGHKQESFYWLEYHNAGTKLTERGGGAITLYLFTPGQLIGLVTSVDCHGRFLNCRVNRWVPFEDEKQYDPKWFSTVGRVNLPGHPEAEHSPNS
jgi:hypothetical protein